MKFDNVIRIVGNCLAVLLLVSAIAIIVTKATTEMNYITGSVLCFGLALSCWQPRAKEKLNSSTYWTWISNNIDNEDRVHKQEWIDNETISISSYDKESHKGVEATFKMVSCESRWDIFD